jgi:hypothetical protein
MDISYRDIAIAFEIIKEELPEDMSYEEALAYMYANPGKKIAVADEGKEEIVTCEDMRETIKKETEHKKPEIKVLKLEEMHLEIGYIKDLPLTKNGREQVIIVTDNENIEWTATKEAE